MLEKKPDHTEALFLLGFIHLRNREFSKAVGCFEETLRADPKHQQATEFLEQAKKLQRTRDADGN